MMGKIKKTSDEWMKILDEKDKLIILDPDGWDRCNYQYSFYEEEISHSEFISRLMESTVLKHNKKGKNDT